MNRICVACGEPFTTDKCLQSLCPSCLLSQDDVNKLEGFAPVTASPAFSACNPLSPSLTQVGERYTELVEAFTELHVALIEENQKLKEQLSRAIGCLEVIAKDEYDFGEEFTGSESAHVAKDGLRSIKECA